MPRYIDAEKLKRQMGILSIDWNTRDEMWMRESDIACYIDTCPEADVVEVVRCKDCKWRRKWKDEKNSYYCAKDNIAILGNLKPNFYCGYGKRRKDNDD